MFKWKSPPSLLLLFALGALLPVASASFRGIRGIFGSKETKLTVSYRDGSEQQLDGATLKEFFQHFDETYDKQADVFQMFGQALNDYQGRSDFSRRLQSLPCPAGKDCRPIGCGSAGDCEDDEVCATLTLDGQTAEACLRVVASASTMCGGRVECPTGAACELVSLNGLFVERCKCQEQLGYVTNPATNITDLANAMANGDLDFYGCIQVDECVAGNTCPSIENGGVCVDLGSDDGSYECFCAQGWKEISSDNNGATSCMEIDECTVEGTSPCAENEDCTNFPGGFTCDCKDGFEENSSGGCVAKEELVENSGACDPDFNNGDECPEFNRFCDPTEKRCKCIEGFFQPAGSGGQCENVDEEAMGMCPDCDEHAKCEDRTPTEDDRRGYTCECLDGYTDVSNTPAGTNCIKVIPPPEATTIPAEIIESITPEVTSAPVIPAGPVTTVCTALGSICATIPGAFCSTGNGGECLCNPGLSLSPMPGTATNSATGAGGDLVCQLNECAQNQTICTSADTNSECFDLPLAATDLAEPQGEGQGYNCECVDGFELNTMGICEPIECLDDTDCVSESSDITDSPQKVCKQVLDTVGGDLLESPGEPNTNEGEKLTNACVCNTFSNDWESVALDRRYCIPDTCSLDASVNCAGTNRARCENAVGSPGYICVCAIGYGEDENGDCVDPCAQDNDDDPDNNLCGENEVCQLVTNSVPNSAPQYFCKLVETKCNDFTCPATSYCVDDGLAVDEQPKCVDPCDGECASGTVCVAAPLDGDGRVTKDSIASCVSTCIDVDCGSKRYCEVTDSGSPQCKSPCDGGEKCPMMSEQCIPDDIAGGAGSFGCFSVCDGYNCGPGSYCDPTSGVPTCVDPCEDAANLCPDQGVSKYVCVASEEPMIGGGINNYMCYDIDQGCGDVAWNCGKGRYCKDETTEGGRVKCKNPCTSGAPKNNCGSNQICLPNNSPGGPGDFTCGCDDLSCGRKKYCIESTGQCENPCADANCPNETPDCEAQPFVVNRGDYICKCNDNSCPPGEYCSGEACIDPCSERQCKNSPNGDVCTLDKSKRFNYACGCTIDDDCDSAGENTKCDTSSGKCKNPCDDTPCDATSEAEFEGSGNSCFPVPPTRGNRKGYECGCETSANCGGFPSLQCVADSDTCEKVTCDNTVCAPGSYCEVEEGTPTCLNPCDVAVRPCNNNKRYCTPALEPSGPGDFTCPKFCDDVVCGEQRYCKVDGGKPTCENPCDVNDCEAYQFCRPFESPQNRNGFECIDKCNNYRCGPGAFCDYNADDRPICIDPCSDNTCKFDQICVARPDATLPSHFDCKERDRGCHDVNCGPGRFCAGTVANDNVRCVNPCTNNNCNDGTICTPDADAKNGNDYKCSCTLESCPNGEYCAADGECKDPCATCDDGYVAGCVPFDNVLFADDRICKCQRKSGSSSDSCPGSQYCFDTFLINKCTDVCHPNPCKFNWLGRTKCVPDTVVDNSGDRSCVRP